MAGILIAGRETTVMESTVYGAAASMRKTNDFDAAVAALAALALDADDFVARFQRASVDQNAEVATKKKDGDAVPDVVMTQELLTLDRWTPRRSRSANAS